MIHYGEIDLKTRALFPIMLALAVSSCTSTTDDTDTSSRETELEQPTLESADAGDEPTTESIKDPTTDESGSPFSEANADGGSAGLDPEVLDLPARDDTIGFAACC